MCLVVCVKGIYYIGKNPKNACSINVKNYVIQKILFIKLYLWDVYLPINTKRA